MICKNLLALFLWCHCYQIVLNPILQLIALGSNSNSNEASPLSLANDHQPDGRLFYVSGSPIMVAANKIAMSPGQEIALRCNIPKYPEAQFNWYRRRVHPYKESYLNSDNKDPLDPKDDRFAISNNVLVIKQSTFADVGDYFCQVQGKLDDNIEVEKMIHVRPKPHIQDFDLESSTMRSAIVDEGHPLNISCNVIDDYYPPESINISWYSFRYDESDINEVNSGEEGIKVESKSRTNSDLIIDQVTQDHRRSYKCQVSNGVTQNSKTILIRVKNKLTVVWPALGIVIELVILIGVICIVENRKVEPDRGVYDRKAIHQM